MRLYLIRHGQSTNNALDDISQRVHDPALTERGQQQAQILADYLTSETDKQVIIRSAEKTEESPAEKYNFTHLYCSAMYRALLTALPVSHALGLPTEVLIDIHESGGLYLDALDGTTTGYPGRNREQILKEFQDYILPETVTDKGWWTYEGREDDTQFQKRVLRVADYLLTRRETNDSIAFITHGNFMSGLIHALLFGHTGERSYFMHYNTAITRIDFLGEYKVLHYVNRVEHLPSEMIT